MTVKLDRATHVYTSKGKAVGLCVSDVLSLAGIVQPYPESARHHVARAGELGETVHQWCDWLDSDADDIESLNALNESVVLPYVTAYQRFRAKHNPVWSHVEESFTKDGVAGTPDRIGTIEVKGLAIPAIIDIKTPKQAAAHWQLQLSGYAWLADRPEHALYAVLLASEGLFRLIPYPSDLESFRCAVGVAKWRLANGGKLRVSAT